MIQSIKVDVIYYCISGDFEMEFNLCGCCRMRLLSDKADGQSAFSKSLARAVGRSRVIMLCGPLFGEKGLIETVSKVTEIETEKLDNSAYDLNTDDEIDILKGATALVTDDGVFGGCIIESDKQSIIILTESKSLRKKIMKQLIYPYITKLSITPGVDPEEEASEEVTPGFETVGMQEAGSDDGETLLSDETEIAEEGDANPASQDDSEQEKDENAGSDPSDNDAPGDDFVIDVSNAGAAQPSKDEQDKTDPFDNPLIIDLTGHDETLSVEERNQKYYLFEDEGNEINDGSKFNVAISILIALIALVAVIILYIAVVKPLILQQDIFENLREMFTSKIFVRLLK